VCGPFLKIPDAAAVYKAIIRLSSSYFLEISPLWELKKKK